MAIRYKNIIWDFDGTLFDTYPLFVEAMGYALSDFGVQAHSGEIFELMMDSAGACLAYYAKINNIDPEELRALYRQNLREGAEPFSEVPGLVAAIAENGGQQFLFTHRRKSAADYLEQAGLAQYFTDIVTWDEKFRRKPDPSGNLHIIQKHGLSRMDTIAIGDREIDVEAGIGAWIATCLITHGRKVKTKADYVAESYTRLSSILGL